MIPVIPPPLNRVLGYANFNGQRIPVEWDVVVYRYLAQSILGRIGGVTGADVDGPTLEALARAMHSQPAQAGLPEPADIGYVRAFVHKPHNAADNQADILHSRAFIPQQPTRPTAANPVEMQAMMPRQTNHATAADDAEVVIASKVFARG